MKKILCLILVFIISFSIVGCSNEDANNKQAMATIDETLTKISTGIKNLETISDNDLIIKEFMNTGPIRSIRSTTLVYRYDNPNQDNGYNGATFTNSSPMTNYVNKLHKVSNIATRSISTNSELDYLKNTLLSRVGLIKANCEQIKEKKCQVSNGQKMAINNLCNNLIVNLNRVNLTRNEIKNEVGKILSLKNNYTNNLDQLGSRYTILVNCMETRNMYFKNMLTSMNGIENILEDICCPSFDYNFDNHCDVSSAENENTNSTSASISPNIDTYENANIKRNNFNYSNRNQYPNTQRTPYYGYGYNNYHYMNPYYGYSMPQMYRNGYGYGPYSNYNPYISNVDTYGNFCNTDTYKSNKQIEKEETEIEQNVAEIEQNDTNSIKTNNILENKNKKTVRRYYTIAEEDYLKCKKILDDQKITQNVNEYKKIVCFFSRLFHFLVG